MGLPTRSYEKYMPHCKETCPSTGCYTKITETHLSFECVECGLISSTALSAAHTVALESLLAERLGTGGESN